ncbi:MAG: sigma-E processing peptidase SpoIIGA [Clostridia bacterium]|nr:sigma-E processing peptidase SpoIIGA [Clostridia bacterium]
MTIYVDIIIIENLIMNFIILYATGLILKIKNSFFRLLIASLVGAIYSALQYITNMKILSNIVIKTILSIIIINIAFHPQNIKKMCKQLLLFYLTTFTFGGVATYLIYILKPQNIIIKNGMFVGTYVLKVIFIGAILGTGILLISFRISKNKISKKDMVCKIKIKLNGKETILNTMVDTGNMLREPITGNPVIVVEKNSLYNLLPKEILNNTESILGGDFGKIPEDMKQEYIPKLKFIPFSSLGKQNGMLIGIKPEKIKVINEDIEEEKENAIIGIYSKSLTKRGEYNALIGIELY